MLRNVTHELVDIHETGQKCLVSSEYGSVELIEADEICLVMNTFNYMESDDNVVYRYRIFSDKRFIDALEYMMFCSGPSTRGQRPDGIAEFLGLARELLESLRYDRHYGIFHYRLDEDQTKAHSVDRWVGLVHDVVVYEDVEPMAVGGES